MKEPLEQPQDSELIFLKLGGSLITDKDRPHTARLDVLTMLAQEIKAALDEKPTRKILLGHGSGSFGHVPAKQYGTRDGVHTAKVWQGFVEVWREASSLNHLVMEALAANDVLAVAIPPSAAVVTNAGKVVSWNLLPIEESLHNGIVPVVYGDVVFDTSWGGTILSTEDLFAYLVPEFRPGAVLLAGIERGVWMDYPACQAIFDKITPEMMALDQLSVAGSESVDVTGGMRSKVAFGMNLVKQFPSMRISIFSGREPENLRQALNGEHIGTMISE